MENVLEHSAGTDRLDELDGALLSEERDPTAALLRRYVLAFTLLALSIVAGHVYMGRTISRNSEDSAQVNVAGRQRMLSQRVVKESQAAVLASQRGDGASSAAWAGRVEATLALWEDAHAALLYGGGRQGLESPAPETAREALRELEPHMEAVASSAREIASGAGDLDAALARMLEHEGPFLEEMDAAVGLIVDVSEMKVRAAMRMEQLLLSVSLLILLAEILLVFEPARRALKRYVLGLRGAIVLAREGERAKQDFLANMSHEIRTPMNSILGFTEVLRDRCTGKAGREEAVRSIERNGTHLLGLINDILDLSKIQHGSMSIQPAACSASRLLEDLRSLLRESARVRGNQLFIESEGLDGVSLELDEMRVRQVLVNLAGNAIKFTDHGEVRVSARLERSRGDRVVFEVSDTGCGISEDGLQELFAPFVQVDASTTRAHGGTGLGLSICQRLTELMGGTIEAESELGVGSTFRVTIPTREIEAPVEVVAEPAASEERAASLKGRRVLLVEDGPDNRRLMVHFLGRMGLEVDEAVDGREGMELALGAVDIDEPYALVLMDMQMPVMDGYEATRALRDRGYRLPIVALTAHALREDRERCLRAGCDDYLSKPVGSDGLRAMCERWVVCGDGPVGATRAA